MSEEKLYERYVSSLSWLRDLFLECDDLANPILGISEWDDACVVDFAGKLVASADGPYDMRLVLKSALIHAATDVVVKGARPVFALDCLGGNEQDVKKMAESLKTQSLAMNIPILGGNTKIEELKPSASITVIGKLEIEEPIPDNGATPGDVIALIGEPIWGEQDERIKLAKLMIKTWFEIIQQVEIHASKDVTKGGLVATIKDMQEKSKTRFDLIDKLPYPVSKNLDNFIITLTKQEFTKLKSICENNKCRLERIGLVSQIQ